MKYFKNSGLSLFLTSQLFHFLYQVCPYMLHFFSVSLISSYSNTNIFTRIHNFSYIKASTHYVACEPPGLSDSSGAECNHLYTLYPGTALFLSGKIGLGGVHSFGDTHLELRKEEDSTSAESSQQSVRGQMLWCNQALL